MSTNENSEYVFNSDTFNYILEAPDEEVKALIYEHMRRMHPTDPACLHRRTVVALGYALGLRRNVHILHAKVEHEYVEETTDGEKFISL